MIRVTPLLHGVKFWWTIIHVVQWDTRVISFVYYFIASLPKSDVTPIRPLSSSFLFIRYKNGLLKLRINLSADLGHTEL